MDIWRYPDNYDRFQLIRKICLCAARLGRVDFLRDTRKLRFLAMNKNHYATFYKEIIEMAGQYGRVAVLGVLKTVWELTEKKYAIAAFFNAFNHGKAFVLEACRDLWQFTSTDVKSQGYRLLFNAASKGRVSIFIELRTRWGFSSSDLQAVQEEYDDMVDAVIEKGHLELLQEWRLHWNRGRDELHVCQQGTLKKVAVSGNVPLLIELREHWGAVAEHWGTDRAHAINTAACLGLLPVLIELRRHWSLTCAADDIYTCNTLMVDRLVLQGRADVLSELRMHWGFARRHLLTFPAECLTKPIEDELKLWQ